MLAEQPAWATHLPDNCAAAFAPFAHGEPNLCAAIQGEFRYFDGMMRNWLASDAADEDKASMDAKQLLPQILAQHSSPARKLSYHETTRQITFERYDRRENAAAQGVAVNVDG